MWLRRRCAIPPFALGVLPTWMEDPSPWAADHIDTLAIRRIQLLAALRKIPERRPHQFAKQRTHGLRFALHEIVSLFPAPPAARLLPPPPESTGKDVSEVTPCARQPALRPQGREATARFFPSIARRCAAGPSPSCRGGGPVSDVLYCVASSSPSDRAPQPARRRPQSAEQREPPPSDPDRQAEQHGPHCQGHRPEQAGEHRCRDRHDASPDVCRPGCAPVAEPPEAAAQHPQPPP